VPGSVGRLAVAVVWLALLAACSGCCVLDPLRLPAREEVTGELGRTNIVAMDDMAVLRRIGSEDVTVQGNGCLAATRDGILFVQWLPRRRIRIPQDRIIDVFAPDRHWLRVVFVDETGRADYALFGVWGSAMAWRQTLLPVELRPVAD
jgi:hypothetical protein